ncbi:DNA polymerase III subunit gamma/tau [Candidatus Daviesbacteria bacterium]|nr:DNA polymerase III subunit gamma/tau [Candidatus Daviesbacteria bacterium]
MAAFYLKYRPQSLNDLIGQDHIKKIILGAFAKHQLSHAYLFVGPRGTGKTSTARILAKMVNCESQIKMPCNKCPACLSITDGSNLDLIEIDAASNRGVEDIRTLREKIKLSPSNAKKKVYIVDECHMLTTEAFNAFLKTLEEPPSHALFILATTDAAKLPQTILSRVQRLDFRLATPEELSLALKRITANEKIDIDEEALKLLVKKSEGSFRDGIKLLDQISTSDGKITLEVLEESLKTSNFDKLLELIKVFSAKDTVKGLTIILQATKEGIDIKDLIISLMDSLRSLVLITNDLGEQMVKPNMMDDKYQELVKVSGQFTNHQLLKILDILQKALEKLKFTSIPSFPLELAVVEICGEETNKTMEDRKLKIVVEDGGLKVENKQIDPLPSILKDPSSNDDISKLKEKWTFVLETIRPYNFSLEALLRSASIKECSDATIIMEVPYSFHQRILEAPKNRDLLEGILSDILGRGIRVSTVLGVRIPKREDIANIEVAADDEIIRAAAEIFNSDSVN